MTTQEFKKMGRILKEVYAELEKEAFAEKVDIFSPEYAKVVDETRLLVLTQFGFTLDEYRAAKELVAPAKKVDVAKAVDESKVEIQGLKDRKIPTPEEMTALAHTVAKEYIKPPQIINKIEKVIEKPTIVKETTIEHITQPYDERPLQEHIGALSRRLDEVQKTVPQPINVEELKTQMREEFGQNLAESINVLGMPNFRKLAMGLQDQIDRLRSSSSGGGVGAWSTPAESPAPDGSVTLFTVGSSAPTDVIADGIHYFNGVGYTFAAGKITFDIGGGGPTQYVRYR